MLTRPLPTSSVPPWAMTRLQLRPAKTAKSSVDRADLVDRRRRQRGGRGGLSGGAARENCDAGQSRPEPSMHGDTLRAGAMFPPWPCGPWPGTASIARGDAARKGRCGPGQAMRQPRAPVRLASWCHEGDREGGGSVVATSDAPPACRSDEPGGRGVRTAVSRGRNEEVLLIAAVA